MLLSARALVVATLVFALLGAPAAALAQGATASPAASPSPSPDARQEELRTRLVGFPISVGPSDSLAVALEVTNSGTSTARDLEVVVTIFRGVTSRSVLQQTYNDRLGNTVAVDTFPVEGGLGPGRTRSIEVTKPLAELGTFRNSTQDRAYPVRVVVRSSRSTSNPINTHMIFFHETPEKPLGLGLVIPLHSPSIYTDGARPDLVTSGTLERSITDGRLARILDALEAHPDLPVTLAPSGLLLSMLADMADGYLRSSQDGPLEVPPEDPRALAAQHTLGRIQGLAARPNTRIIPTTYSPTSLPALYRNGLQELAATQLSEGRNVLLAEPLGLLRSQPLEGWILPTFGDMDQPVLTQLHRTEFTKLIISSRSLSPTDNPFTRALPVKLEGGPGSATEGLTGVETIALVADTGLESQIERSGRLGTIEARQRFAAETATIHLETPGLVRAVVAKAPPDWEAENDSALSLLDVIESAPWLTPTTPDAIAAELQPPARERVRLASSDTVLENGPDLPSPQYFQALSEAQRAIARYSGLSPPSAQVGALSRRLLIAESTDWWVGRRSVAQAQSFAEAIPPAVAAEMRKVLAPAPQTITLTSNTGVIPLSIGSRLEYPVDVVLRLDSDKLRFPDGNRVDISNLQPPNQTIRVRAITQSSGTFPLGVRLYTPDGTLITDSQLTIRSTAYNVVALWITGAAGVFLIGWWMVGWVRRRLRPPDGPPDEPAETGAAEPAGGARDEKVVVEPAEPPEEPSESPEQEPVPAHVSGSAVDDAVPASEQPSEAG